MMPPRPPKESEAGPSKWAGRVSEDAWSGYVDIDGNVTMRGGLDTDEEADGEIQSPDEMTTARIDSKFNSSHEVEFSMNPTEKSIQTTVDQADPAQSETDKTQQDSNQAPRTHEAHLNHLHLEDLKMRICLPAHVPPPPTPELESLTTNDTLKPLTPIHLPGAFPVEAVEHEKEVLMPVDSRRESGVVSWFKEGVVGNGNSVGERERKIPMEICPLTEAARAALER